MVKYEPKQRKNSPKFNQERRGNFPSKRRTRRKNVSRKEFFVENAKARKKIQNIGGKLTVRTIPKTKRREGGRVRLFSPIGIASAEERL